MKSIKKLLVVIPSYQHGGTNRSFTNIIDLFNFPEHNIELHVLCVKSEHDGFYYKEYQKRGVKFVKANGVLIALFGRKNPIVSRVVKHIPYNLQDYIIKNICRQYSNKYDFVISMEEGVATRIASFVCAPQKIAWVRSIYTPEGIKDNSNVLNNYYSKFDRIVSVSNACKKAFLACFPQYEDKSFVIRNTQNRDAIIKKAYLDSAIVMKNDCYHIVSVGRLDKVKQFDIIPEIARKLQDDGIDFKWYILGEGEERYNIQKRIEDNSVENCVCLLGAIDNPYPIIRDADIVVITSKSESFCNVIVESEILCTPVISTPFPASYDTMQDKINGVICELPEFPECIKRILLTRKKEKQILIPTNKDDKNTIEFINRLENLLCR